MKKTVKLLSILTLLAMLSACNAVVADNSVDYSNETLVGKISEINGNVVTLELGKLKKSEMAMQPQMNGEVPEMPADDQMPEMNGDVPALPEDGQMPQGDRPPMMHGGPKEGGFNPNSEDQSQIPEDGQMPEMNGDVPELPQDGQAPEMNGEAPAMSEDGQFPPMDGNIPQMNDGAFSQNKTYTFKSKNKTVELTLEDTEVTLSDSTAGTIADLKVGDVVEIVYGSNNNIESIKVYEVSENTEQTYNFDPVA